MATLIPTAYRIILDSLNVDHVEIVSHGSGWAAYTGARQLVQFVGHGGPVWERTGPDASGPTIFPTAQSAADAAEIARWP